MDLYITQNSYYFVHRHFLKFYEKDNSEVIYVSEKNRGLVEKYYEILVNLGIFNSFISAFCEFFFFLKLYKRQSNLRKTKVTDLKLNELLEQRIKTGVYLRIISIGCPTKIDASLQEKFNVKILNLHGGIVPFQKGRFSPVKSLMKGHKYLGASLYFISDLFDDGEVLSQDAFEINNSRILENYNKVLIVSASLLDSFFKGNLLTISGEILNSLGKER